MFFGAAGGSSESTEYSASPGRPCRSSVDADLNLGRVLDESEGGVGCLVAE